MSGMVCLGTKVFDETYFFLINNSIHTHSPCIQLEIFCSAEFAEYFDLRGVRPMACWRSKIRNSYKNGRRNSCFRWKLFFKGKESRYIFYSRQSLTRNRYKYCLVSDFVSRIVSTPISLFYLQWSLHENAGSVIDLTSHRATKTGFIP